jgi:chromosome segregation ATPase
MSDKINAFFQLLEGRFGLHPTSVATIALVIVLLFAFLLLYLFIKLRSEREVIHQLGERLGYDPPYEDGVEILHEEIRKDILLRGREIKIKQLEQNVADLEAEGNTKDANLTTLQRRSKEIEDELQQASLRNDNVTAQANEQAQAHRTAVEQLEQRMRDMEAESTTSLTALQQRSKVLEEQVQQASIQNEKLTAQAGEQAQAHRIAVEQLEQRMRQMETEGSAYLTTLEQRSKELEDQLQQASLQHDELLAQAGEQAQAHRITVEQLEQRLRDMEAESNGNLSALQQRSKELEEQLQQASLRNDEFATQAGEQTQAHRTAVEQLEQCIRDMEAEGIANLAALQQRSKELEEQLQLATIHNDNVAAQAGEQAQAHRIAVEQLEQRMRDMEAESLASLAAHQQRSKELEEQLQQVSFRNDEFATQTGEQAKAHQINVEQLEQRVRDMEAEGNANLSALQRRSKELEEQLQQASLRNDELTAQTFEQAQAHRIAIEQFEQRMRDMEAESSASLASLQQRAKELEDQLHHATIRNENEDSIAHQETLEQSAIMERLELRIRDLEAEKSIEESRVKALESNLKELEEQLQHAADRMTPETEEIAETEVAKAAVANGEAAVNTSELLLRRAEWITACAVGAILPHGLVAAEAYASAALAANPQGIDAPQLLAELARIHRAYPEGLPSVIEAVTTFDERAAAFFAADVARAADIADDEAQRRYRAGLNRSALLAVDVAIELRQKTAAENSPGMQRLQEMKASLLARLGNNAKTSNAAPRVAS